jgi:PAS domain S-box-containing protein
MIPRSQGDDRLKGRRLLRSVWGRLDRSPWLHQGTSYEPRLGADRRLRARRGGAVLAGGRSASGHVGGRQHGTFIVLGGVHAPLVDAGVVETPYMIGFAFLAIVLALSYELVSDAVLASRYAKEIRASEARWRSLLTNVQLAVIGIDPKGRIKYANPFLQRLIEYPREDLIGTSVASLVPEPDRSALAERLAAAAQTGPRPHSRWDLVCASGARRSLAWSTVRLNDPDVGDGARFSFTLPLTNSDQTGD